MKNYFINLISLCLIFSILTGCLSVAGFEEARSLREGTKQLPISSNAICLPELLDDDFVFSEENIFIINLDINYIYGVNDQIDVGLRLNSNSNLGFFLKYQLLGDQLSKFALGSGLEIASFIRVSNSTLLPSIANNVQFPLHISFYPSEYININLSPRLVYQFPSRSFDTSLTYLGGNFSVLYGKKIRFGLDVGYYNINNSVHMVSFGLGGKMRFGEVVDTKFSQ